MACHPPKTKAANRLLLVPVGAMMLTEDDKDGADGEFMALMLSASGRYGQ